MKPVERVLYFFILPIISVLFYPPDLLLGGLVVIPVVIATFILLGIILWRGNLTMLTFCAFIQGLNVITRIMMFFPHTVSKNGTVDVVYMITNIISIILSVYILLRYDDNKFRLQMQHH